MIQNLLVACGLALSVGVSSFNSNDHNIDSMRTQSTTIYDGGVTTVTTQYQYQTNDVSDVSDLVIGNIYKFTLSDLDVTTELDIYTSLFRFNDINFSIDGYFINVHVNGSTDNDVSFELDANSIFHIGFSVSVGQSFYFVYGVNSSINSDDIVYISDSDYLGEEITSVTNVMPTSLLEIFDNFINERIFNHSKLATLKTTIFGQEMSVASWLSLSVSIVLGILFLVVLLKGAIWLFKIVGNLALLR